MPLFIRKREQKGKKLSGAGQKRYKKLLESGHSRAEAFSLAKNPLTPSDPYKRPRNSDLNGSNTSGNPTPAKIARQNWGTRKPPVKNISVQNRIDAFRSEHSEPPRGKEGKVNPSYSDVAKYVKLGVLPKGYPNMELTTAQLIATQKAILAKVAGQRKAPLKPKFGDCVFKSGYLVIVCKNKETADWLKSIISTVTPWSGAELLAVDEKEIPRPEILIGFFPWSSEDKNEEILTLLESQNDGLAVDAWRILQRNVKNQHVELVFTVDGGSLNSIKNSKFILDFKFGNANIRKKFQKRNLHDGSERPGQRDDGESQKTHVGTGDDKMIVDQIDEIPGPSGVESKKTNRNAPGYTTNTVGDKRKEKNTPQKQGLKPGYKITRIQAENNPNKGNRKTNVGEELNPHASGEQQQLQQQ
ncbi:uncharacterized protein LOC135711330 [Ochlerotatus camptorhynchus]|uniref:uncharacterized protein LOC135711330 n=1 Tax=Ochlerotatus camptorhynchus TaxID=644619 RepID=UPI0031D92809